MDFSLENNFESLMENMLLRKAKMVLKAVSKHKVASGNPIQKMH